MLHIRRKKQTYFERRRVDRDVCLIRLDTSQHLWTLNRYLSEASVLIVEHFPCLDCWVCTEIISQVHPSSPCWTVMACFFIMDLIIYILVCVNTMCVSNCRVDFVLLLFSRCLFMSINAPRVLLQIIFLISCPLIPLAEKVCAPLMINLDLPVFQSMSKSYHFDWKVQDRASLKMANNWKSLYWSRYGKGFCLFVTKAWNVALYSCMSCERYLGVKPSLICP